jgi:hypothetical protein
MRRLRHLQIPTTSATAPPTFDPFVIYEQVPLLSVREIAATKAYTIGRRGAYKGYIDLYFILSEQHATLTDIIDVAEKKFGVEFNSRLFLAVC